MSQHVHFSSCGCAEEARKPHDLYDLHGAIVMAETVAMNEKKFGSVKDVLKPMEDMMTESSVESDCDGEILIKVTFEKQVKMKAICVRALDKDKSPKNIKVWFNRDDIDFSNCHDIPPSQSIALPFDPMGTFRNGIRPALGGNVHTATLLLNSPYGDDELDVNYIGMFGWVQGFKGGIFKGSVEINPNVSDHNLQIDNVMGNAFISK